MLTAKDSAVVEVTCPVCQRPAKVYSRNGHDYLRCTWEDCRLNRNMVVPSAEAFYSKIEQFEKEEDGE